MLERDFLKALDDARTAYNGLLNATSDPTRQAALQHDLQQLLLMISRPAGELH